MSQKALIITGGAKRVGAVLAKHFASNGYDIALHYHHSESEAQTVKADIEALGKRCMLFQQDLADIAALPAWMERIHTALPHCTALINNASIFGRATFMDTDEAFYDRQMDINFKAPFFITQAFAKRFAKGTVINIIDSNITQSHGSHFAYLLAKKTLAEFTVMAARALGPQISVNAICPGCILPADDTDAHYVEKMRDAIPLKRHPIPQNIAETALWLTEQTSITGQLIYVDGGMHVL
jgi:pteridine reductase